MHLIIDGYNVLKSRELPLSLAKLSFEELRKTFINKLARYCSGRTHKVTVVFDGAKAENSFSSPESMHGIKVIYSKQHETADDVIKKIIEDSANPGELLIVSSDREVQHYAKLYGASVVYAKELYNKLSLHKSPEKDMYSINSPEYFEKYIKGYEEEDESISKKGIAKREKRKKPYQKTLWSLILCIFVNLSADAYDSGWLSAENINLYSNGNLCLEAIKKIITSAKESIDIEMYEFQNQDIADILIKKAGSKINVRVILDPSAYGNKEMKQYLRQGGVKVNYYPINKEKNKINHIKLILVDKKNAILGSANLGVHSPYNNDIAVELTGKAVSKLAEIFEQDWDFTCARKINELPKAQNNRGNVRIVTDADISKELLKTISNAKEHIYISMFVFTDKIIFEELKKAQNRKLDVKVLLHNDEELNLNIFEKLEQAQISVKWYNANKETNEKLHTKLVIVDNIAFLGSANLTYHGLQVNHECDIIINDSMTLQKLIKKFKEDWKK